MGLSAYFDVKRFADESLERRGMAGRSPELQFGVSRRPHLQQRVRATVVKLEAGNRLRMAAIEAFRQSKDGGERSHDLPPLAREGPEPIVLALGDRPPVVARDEGNRLDFLRVESAQVPIPDQIVRVLVMPLVADVDTNVVQQRGELEPLAFAVRESVRVARLVEQRQCQTRHLLRVLRPVIAPFGELDDAAPPHVGIPLGLRNLLAMARDILEHQSFAEREVAQGQFGGAKPTHDRVGKNRSGHGKIGATRVQSRHAEPMPEIERREHASDVAELLQ